MTFPLLVFILQAKYNEYLLTAVATMQFKSWWISFAEHRCPEFKVFHNIVGQLPYFLNEQRIISYRLKRLLHISESKILDRFLKQRIIKHRGETAFSIRHLPAATVVQEPTDKSDLGSRVNMRQSPYPLFKQFGQTVFVISTFSRLLFNFCPAILIIQHSDIKAIVLQKLRYSRCAITLSQHINQYVFTERCLLNILQDVFPSFALHKNSTAMR